MIDGRDFIKSLIKNREILKQDDNIYYADKLFIINSVVEWIQSRVRKDSITRSQLRNYASIIQNYLDNKLGLHWEGDDLMVSVHKKSWKNPFTKKKNSDTDKEAQ